MKRLLVPQSGRDQAAVHFANVFAPKRKDQIVDLIVIRQEFSGCCDGDLCRVQDRKAIRAATDRGKRDGPNFVFNRDLQRVAITIREDFRFAATTSHPERADGVDDKTRRQIVSASEFRFAGLATAKCLTFRKKLRSRSAMNCTVNSAAAQQGRVGRVDNCVDIEPGDVAVDDVDLRIRNFSSARAITGLVIRNSHLGEDFLAIRESRIA